MGFLVGLLIVRVMKIGRDEAFGFGFEGFFRLNIYLEFESHGFYS